MRIGTKLAQPPAKKPKKGYEPPTEPRPPARDLDKEALAAFMTCTKVEGIIPALESAHGLAQVLKLAPTMGKDDTIVLTLSGRGDKDVESVGKHLGMTF